MDMITDLPPITLENGTIIDAVMVVVDHGLTKGVVLTPCAKTLTHEGAGDILLNHVYKHFGLTCICHSHVSILGYCPTHFINAYGQNLTTQKNGVLPWCWGWLGLVIGSFG